MTALLIFTDRIPLFIKGPKLLQLKRIAVFCGSSTGFHPEYTAHARELGQAFSDRKIGLVYGGGKIGLMGVLADTILENGGEVIGVIPKLLRHKEVAHNKVTRMIITKKMSERKVSISKLVDAYIALPGGFGTFDEVFEALTLGQLGIEVKPVGLLNTRGYFNALLQQLDNMVSEGFLKKSNRDMLLVSDNVDELLLKMENYQAPAMTKVIETVVKK